MEYRLLILISKVDSAQIWGPGIYICNKHPTNNHQGNSDAGVKGLEVGMHKPLFLQYSLNTYNMVLRTADSVSNKINNKENPSLRNLLHPKGEEIENKYMTSAGVKCYREK